jgi:hypothetical protein
MSWKWMRTLITIALMVGIFILATRGIHFETIPFKFTLKMAGNTYACTRAGIVVDCTNG